MYTKWNIISRLITREPKEAIIIIINFLITIPAQHLHLYCKMPMSGRYKEEDVTEERVAKNERFPLLFYFPFSEIQFCIPHTLLPTTTLNLNYRGSPLRLGRHRERGRPEEPAVEGCKNWLTLASGLYTGASGSEQHPALIDGFSSQNSQEE